MGGLHGVYWGLDEYLGTPMAAQNASIKKIEAVIVLQAWIKRNSHSIID
jgi:hypothetical protein